MKSGKRTPKKHKERNTPAAATYEIRRFRPNADPKGTTTPGNATNTFDEYCIDQVGKHKGSPEISKDGDLSAGGKQVYMISNNGNNEYGDSAAHEQTIFQGNETFLKSGVKFR